MYRTSSWMRFIKPVLPIMSDETLETHDGYTLRSRGDIIDKFKIMRRQRCLLTAQVKDSRIGFATSVIEVLVDRGLVVFDVSADEAVNQRFATAQEIVFDGLVEGIKIRFTVERFSEALWHGEPVFAAPLPESLFWHQQRKFYRVAVPLAMPVGCWMMLGESRRELPVLDISISGLALYDKSLKIGDDFAIGQVLEDCGLRLPERGVIRVGLEIRNKIPRANPPIGQRVGCAFHGLGRNDEVGLQKFMFEVELYKKRHDELVKS